MKIKLAQDTINREIINSLVEWLQQEPLPQLTKGELTKQLEEKWAKMVGTEYSLFVNSGSSAILLLLAGIKEMLGRNIPLKIVVPALSWATDVSSPMLLEYDITLCDCNITDLSCDLNNLEWIFKYRSPDVFLGVSVLGLVPDISEIHYLCDKYNVIFLEDNCESMGSRYGEAMLGCFGRASVFSMYYGHHLSTIEGGFINTSDIALYNILVSMRSHGFAREWRSEVRDNMLNKWKINEFDSLYTFFYPGMNVRSTDLQAFIGLKMLDKLDTYSDIRNANFKTYKENVKRNWLDIKEREGDFISNFAYPVVSTNRNEMVKQLKELGVETRPLIAGSISKQPFYVKKYGSVVMDNADFIHKYGFYLPNHQNLNYDDIIKITDIINEIS